MIIGKGLIASVFSKPGVVHDDLIVFASGVSNSSETSEREFQREVNLLQDTIRAFPEKRLIYFSTISIFDPALKDRAYVRHKIKMEKLIPAVCKDFLIVRAPNVVGKGGNRTTLMNFFIERINEGKPFEIWKNSERNFLGVDDFALLSIDIAKKIRQNDTVDLTYPYSFLVQDVVKEVENFLRKDAHYKVVGKGEKYVPETPEPVMDSFRDLEISITKDYIQHLLKTYY